jgi:hypothetical protein
VIPLFGAASVLVRPHLDLSVIPLLPPIPAPHVHSHANQSTDLESLFSLLNRVCELARRVQNERRRRRRRIGTRSAARSLSRGACIATTTAITTVVDAVVFSIDFGVVAVDTGKGGGCRAIGSRRRTVAARRSRIAACAQGAYRSLRARDERTG